MNDWSRQAVSAAEAVGKLQSGMNVFVHGASATPTPLLEALCARTDLTGLKLYHMHTAGPAPFVEPSCQGRMTSYSLFTGEPVRRAVQCGQADFIPVFLSDIPDLFRSGRIRLDAALLQVLQQRVDFVLVRSVLLLRRHLDKHFKLAELLFDLQRRGDYSLEAL